MKTLSFFVPFAEASAKGFLYDFSSLSVCIKVKSKYEQTFFLIPNKRRIHMNPLSKLELPPKLEPYRTEIEKHVSLTSTSIRL